MEAQHKMEVAAAWESQGSSLSALDSKENRATAYNSMDTPPTLKVQTSSVDGYYKPLSAHEEHPWRGKTAFGFATILNRNGEHGDMGSSPVGMSLPPLQAYPMSSLDPKKATHGRMTPIAPLGDNIDHLSSLPGRSLKLKIKKKHIDMSPSFQTPIAPSSAAASSSAVRKLPLAPAPALDDDDDDSGDEIEEGAVSTNGTALRGGRWTSEEHERFLSGFRLHGHKWKRVQMVVRSRTVTQVRTHAQKYLLKLQKISGEPRADLTSNEQRYLNTATFGSGATSPTQSMHSAVDDVEMTTVDQSSMPPRSPDSAMPHDMHVSPSKLKRSTPTKGVKPPLKKAKRGKTDSAFIEEAAYALCSLMTQHIMEDLEMTDHEEDVEMMLERTTTTTTHHKKRYLCRKCRVPKKGHVCDVPDDDAKKSDDDDGDDESATDPLTAEWQDVTNFVGHSILRCFGPNAWARGTIDQVVQADDDDDADQIHVVYSDKSTDAEWLSKADAIDCVALESADGHVVFSGSHLLETAAARRQLDDAAAASAVSTLSREESEP
ncbi:Aste57867_14392 [Aphanomyces stellatus]|uniref:Aste57867_14392 protein n=1 Tax=Aphanomyces stellatus TaxID=120398 RepID=A0A485L1M2_9STRA|nr:hypothetical protein As57867_014338 [Aphanomyces stellatus]VFT91214.1 Aste57867_14392 [Aphanomyces stellatus]